MHDKENRNLTKNQTNCDSCQQCVCCTIIWFCDNLSMRKTILHVNTIGIANDSINRKQIASDETMKN